MAYLLVICHIFSIHSVAFCLFMQAGLLYCRFMYTDRKMALFVAFRLILYK